MARVDVTVVQTAPNAVATPVPVTADATNEMQILAGAVNAKDVLVYLYGDSTNPITYDFKAGVGSMASQGDLQVVLAAGSDRVVALEGARFGQADGNIYIDVTGTVVTATVGALAVY